MNRKDYLRQSIDIIKRGQTLNLKKSLMEADDPTMQEWEIFWKENNDGNTVAPMIKTIAAFINQKQPEIDNITIIDELKAVGVNEKGLRPTNPVNANIAKTAIASILNIKTTPEEPKAEEPAAEKPGISGEPSDEVRKAAFSALRNTGLRAKESQVAVQRATSVLGVDATEEEMIRTAFKYKDQEPSPEDIKKEPEAKEATGKSLSDKLGPDKSAEDATADQIIQHIQDEYEMDREEAEDIAQKAGVNIGTEEPIGQNAAEEVTRTVTQGVEAGSYEERGSDIQETTLELYGKFLPSLKSAIVAGKEVKNNKTIDQLSDIEKMGLTFLISMGKIR